uniref:CCHC-type domain-containing protein n=1 Tax=Oryza brachyantha TaxID=4533 RepID=J3KZU0_ORYBR
MPATLPSSMPTASPTVALTSTPTVVLAAPSSPTPLTTGLELSEPTSVDATTTNKRDLISTTPVKPAVMLPLSITGVGGSSREDVVIATSSIGTVMVPTGTSPDTPSSMTQMQITWVKEGRTDGIRLDASEDQLDIARLKDYIEQSMKIVKGWASRLDLDLGGRSKGLLVLSCEFGDSCWPCGGTSLKKLTVSVWKVVCIGVKDMPEDEEDLTPAQELLIHRNAQAASMTLNSLSPEEFNKVDQLDEAKEIWDTLRIAHEGSRGVRESKIELLEGKLGRFVMEDDETPQKMYDRMMVTVNKTDQVALEAISSRNPTLVTLIRESSGFKRMTPSDMPSRIISHELLEEEAKEVKKYATNFAQIKNKEVAFKAKKGSSKLQEESSSDSESEDEELSLFVHKFKKFLHKKSYGRKDEDPYKRQSKKACYECKEFGHFIADCPKLVKTKEGKGKTKYFKRRPERAHIGEEWFSSNNESDKE